MTRFAFIGGPSPEPACYHLPFSLTPATIRPARFEDYPQIDSVLRGNGLPGYSRDAWLHLWLNNPAYNAAGEDWNIGWVLETGSGELAGTIGAVPFAYEFRGKRLLAAACVAWAVNPAYRALALSLLCRLSSQPNLDFLLSTTTGPSAVAALAARNFSRPAVGRWDSCGFWITNYSGFAQRWLASHATASRLVAPALSAADTLSRAMNHRRAPAGLTFSTVFDERFDAFWEELRVRKTHVLLPVRSRAVLEWHFKNAQRENRLWVLTAAGARGNLLAYAVFERRDNRETGLKRIRIADCQLLAPNNSLCAALLSCALDRCRAEGIHVLEDCGCWFEGPRYLDQPAPCHRPLPSWSYFSKPLRQGLGAVLEDASCWDPTAFDGDASL